MKPGDVRLSAIPLIGAFGKSELEIAAALLVRTCFLNGNRWHAVDLDEILAAAENDSRMQFWLSNPFLNPDWWGLVDGGYASRDRTGGPIEFTEKGLAEIEKWELL